MAVDKLKVEAVLFFKVVEAVYVRNEPQIPYVVEGNVDLLPAVMVSLNDEHVIVIDEGVLLVEHGGHV